MQSELINQRQVHLYTREKEYTVQRRPCMQPTPPSVKSAIEAECGCCARRYVKKVVPVSFYSIL